MSFLPPPELRNTLERASILCDGGLITAEHLGLTARVARAEQAITSSEGVPGLLDQGHPPRLTLDLIERDMIERALNKARFNKSKAAKALGLTRHQLYIRMRKHALQ